MIKTIEYWEVFKDRGGVYTDTFLGNFSTEAVAKTVANSIGNGSTNVRVKHHLVEICETREDRDSIFLRDERREILKKLTLRERHVLGFSDADLV